MQPPIPGEVQELAAGLRCVLAPNAGPMTHWGTNTFLLGETEVAVIDPGPDDAQHMDALLHATRGQTISHILVTHAHADHSPLAQRLSRHTDAPVYGFGPATAGRSATMKHLAEEGLVGGGEGLDQAFAPDHTIGEGDRISGIDWHVDVLHTPGHFAGHLAFSCEHGLISGDHVMDWSSSLVSPPDGDLAAFMSTSRRLRDLNLHRLFPGHGAPIEAPSERLAWLIDHRMARDVSIQDALTEQPQTLAQITAQVYTDVPSKMLPAAARNVFAHLIDMVETNRAEATPQLGFEAQFRKL